MCIGRVSLCCSHQARTHTHTQTINKRKRLCGYHFSLFRSLFMDVLPPWPFSLRSTIAHLSDTIGIYYCSYSVRYCVCKMFFGFIFLFIFYILQFLNIIVGPSYSISYISIIYIYIYNLYRSYYLLNYRAQFSDHFFFSCDSIRVKFYSLGVNT